MTLGRYGVGVHDPSILVGLSELEGVQIVCVLDFYDGPLDGLARLDGREYWFLAVADRAGSGVPSWPRLFVVHELTPDQVALVWAEHARFTEFAAGEDDPAAWAQVWDSRVDYSSAPAVGWFADQPG